MTGWRRDAMWAAILAAFAIGFVFTIDTSHGWLSAIAALFGAGSAAYLTYRAVEGRTDERKAAARWKTGRYS